MSWDKDAYNVTVTFGELPGSVTDVGTTPDNADGTREPSPGDAAVIRRSDSEEAPVRGRGEERREALKWRMRRHRVA